MINNELLNYIKSEISKGHSHEDIKSSLVNTGGWNPSDIEEAFNSLTQSLPIILTPNNSKKRFKLIFITPIIFILIGGVAFIGWKFYEPEMQNLLGINFAEEKTDATAEEDIGQAHDVFSPEISGTLNQSKLDAPKEAIINNSPWKTVSFNDLSDLAMAGTEYECSMSFNKKISDKVEMTFSMKYYFSKTKSNTQINFSGGGMSYAMYAISDGEYIYSWSPLLLGNRGIKAKLENDLEATKSYLDQFKYNYDQVPSEDKIPDFNCRTTSINPAKFVPPANITFELIKTPADIYKGMCPNGICKNNPQISEPSLIKLLYPIEAQKIVSGSKLVIKYELLKDIKDSFSVMVILKGSEGCSQFISNKAKGIYTLECTIDNKGIVPASITVSEINYKDGTYASKEIQLEKITAQ